MHRHMFQKGVLWMTLFERSMVTFTPSASAKLLQDFWSKWEQLEEG